LSGLAKAFTTSPLKLSEQKSDSKKIYSNIDLDLVEFDDDEIDVEDFESYIETAEALKTAKEMKQKIKLLKRYMKNLKKEIADGTVDFKRVAPSLPKNILKSTFSPKSSSQFITSGYLDAQGQLLSEEQYDDEPLSFEHVEYNESRRARILDMLVSPVPTYSKTANKRPPPFNLNTQSIGSKGSKMDKSQTPTIPSLRLDDLSPPELP